MNLDDMPVSLLPSERRAALEQLGSALRLAVSAASQDAQAAERAEPESECEHCGEPVRPGASLCDRCLLDGSACGTCGG